MLTNRSEAASLRVQHLFEVKDKMGQKVKNVTHELPGVPSKTFIRCLRLSLLLCCRQRALHHPTWDSVQMQSLSGWSRGDSGDQSWLDSVQRYDAPRHSFQIMA